eukprot:CAMPEP_0185496310 /NCGR_PEP_ID=MMETSP1366-20130426/18192_1 /TAXON_ID=38817 /ORGANISM="Gephyrocapsa oceanica, Strain RCC1303" /LENGTH=216 /DNA_ID=CAMNT_0028105377 /DNA_START=147 /DNA_END=795 /DNA_ORIENTATION=+
MIRAARLSCASHRPDLLALPPLGAIAVVARPRRRSAPAARLLAPLLRSLHSQLELGPEAAVEAHRRRRVLLRRVASFLDPPLQKLGGEVAQLARPAGPGAEQRGQPARRVAHQPARVPEPEGRKVVLQIVPDDNLALEQGTDLLRHRFEGRRGGEHRRRHARPARSVVGHSAGRPAVRKVDNLLRLVDDADGGELGRQPARSDADHLAVDGKHASR